MRKSSAIKQTIKSLGRNTATIRDKFQAVLCEVAAHAYVNGDARLYNDVLEAASGLNRKAMSKWINTYGFARVTKDGVVLNKSARKEADFADGDAVIAYLTNEVPAWHVTEESLEQIAKELDICARMESVINSAGKDNTIIKATDLERYRALRAQLDAIVGEAA